MATSGVWRRRRLAAAALLAIIALIGMPALARADGDPASDVLVAAPPLFLSASSGATYAEKATLVGQLQRAKRAGHPLRVAVISHRYDLGSVPALWQHPQTYAEFLGGELSLQYHGELLVVMPNGFGVAVGGRPLRTALATLAPRDGQLLTATEQAVQRLTGVTAGHVRIASVSSPSRTSGPGWWIATVLAVGILCGAWTASLRARPPRRRRHGHETIARPLPDGKDLADRDGMR